MFTRWILTCACAAMLATFTLPAAAQPDHAHDHAHDHARIHAADAAGPIVVDDQMSLESLDQKFCYMIGNDVGEFLSTHPMDVEVDVDVFVRGFEDGLAGNSAITEEQKMAISQMIHAAAERQRQHAHEAQAEQGQAYLHENAQREDVTVTDSGLQYRVIEAGEGPRPRAQDQVRVHYRGRLVDGTQFDSSHDRGQPATFGVTQVIAGWTEALMLMNQGAVWQIVCPPDLAYGQAGAGGVIPPNAVLIFDVELLDVIPAQGDAAP
jgi:FKBP-type peptidyl-prolyl cis-trans isomerase